MEEKYEVIGNLLYNMYLRDELEMSGSGNTRDVYVYGKYALKIQTTDYGDHNFIEYSDYQRYISRKIDHLFTKVYAIAGNSKWLLVERVEACFGDNNSWSDEVHYESPCIDEKDAEEWMEEYGIPEEVIDQLADNCIFNIGRRFLTGEYVILDFA